jgi:long-chain fatty acid transport protein
MKTYLKFRMRSHKVLLLLLLVLLYPATGYSLDNDFWSTGLGFQFYPPGARALGMGGAFVGIADDATAAASNPAGIAQLTHMQLAIEGRYVARDSKEKSAPWNAPLFLQDGTFVGTAPAFDNATSEVDDSTDVSFGAFTTPVFNNLFNISLFYDKPMSFSVKKVNGRGLDGGPVTNSERSENDFSIDEAGLSVAKSFCDGRVMLGAGVGVQFFSIEQREAGFQFLGDGSSFEYLRSNVDETDEGVSYRVGILTKPWDNLRIGASYTRMPRFDYKDKLATRGTPVADFDQFQFDSEFDVPDNISFGTAYNIFPNWVVLFEARYIMYSQLEKGFAVKFAYPDAPLGVNDFGQVGRVGSLASDYSVPDIVEIHFGTEYVLNAIQNVPIALRTGFYYEPAHDIKYTKPEIIPDLLNRPRSELNNLEAGLFDGGDDLWHFTVGTGAVFYNHFQVDVGADLTEESQNVALSMVYQF